MVIENRPEKALGPSGDGLASGDESCEKDSCVATSGDMPLDSGSNRGGNVSVSEDDDTYDKIDLSDIP